MTSPGDIRKILDRFYREFDFSERVGHDPIEFPHRYASNSDKEVAGFIASCFAYGKIELFKPVIEKILSRMGSSPYDFLLEFDPEERHKAFAGIKYRFNRNEDIISLLYAVSRIIRQYGSIEKAFKTHYRNEDLNIGRGLSGLMDDLLGTETCTAYGKNIKAAGFAQFFPSPADGSACKRANLFLRWMIRDRDIDFGIWKGIPKNKLVIPLDVHIAKIARCIGLTGRRGQSWKTAVEITEALKRLDPQDPVKYDFALCHQGISGLCRGSKKEEICTSCIFKR